MVAEMIDHDRQEQPRRHAATRFPSGWVNGKPPPVKHDQCSPIGAGLPIFRPELMLSQPLIHPGDRIFVAGHRGMAGSAILRALIGKAWCPQWRAVLTATREQLI